MNEMIIVGAPNSGKSLLFNRLTGLNQKVANFPGVTIDVNSAPSLANPDIELIDFPGVYSLNPISEEEVVSVNEFKKSLKRKNLNAIICLLDATRIERGLYFALQVIKEAQISKRPVLLLVNMCDILEKNNIKMKLELLQKELSTPVIPLSAKTGKGLQELESWLKNHEIPKVTPINLPEDLRKHAHNLAGKINTSYDFLTQTQKKLDNFFLHSFTGGLFFFAIMYALFQSIFTWAAPAMDLVETGLGFISQTFLPYISNSVLRDFFNDALIGGIGAFLVFVPQIFILTFIMGLLEDSGYLARAAVICHRPLRFFGLTGKSFIPMLSGVACAIPGIYAARTIESPFKRWLTYFAVPLMPCSARLPVYALLIAAFIPAKSYGLMGSQGLAMVGIYLFGIICALLVTSLLNTFAPKDNTDIPFVMEMPPYRVPAFNPILRQSLYRSWLFLSKAGPIIFVVTLFVWILGYFPNYGASLNDSWLGSLGKIIEPLFAPLGLDWKFGVAIFTSFLAREVFVGTLGTLFSIENADENIHGLATQIQESGLSLGSGLALFVFFAIAMQCVSTLAVLKKESGSWKLPVQIFLTYSALAYTAALVTTFLF